MKVYILVLSVFLGLMTAVFLQKRSLTAQPIPENNNLNHVFHYPASFVAQLKNDPKAGEKIFYEFCASCHDKERVVPVLAPRMGIPSEWYPYQRLSLELLFKLVNNGNGAMPARGGCFECSDEQLKQAIKYIIKNQ